MESGESILVFDKFMGYAVGGAQRSLRTLLSALPAQSLRLFGCRVRRTFGASSFEESDVSVDRVPIIELSRFPYIEYLLNRGRVRRHLQSRNGAVLITQGLWGANAVRAASCSTVYFVRDEYQLNRIPLYQRGLLKWLKVFYLGVQLPGIVVLFYDNRRAMRQASVVIANSRFMQKEIKKKFGRAAELIYSPVNSIGVVDKKIPPCSDRPFLTLIGSEYMKGRRIVERLAERMLTHQFLIVGRSITRPYAKGNITYQPWTKNPEEIFERTKILLLPSLCYEAFPRVAIEALSRGIPVIGSRRGGTVEIVPEEWLTDDLWNLDEWQRLIEKREETGDVDSEAMREKFRLFDAKIQQQKFVSLVHSLTDTV